MRKVLALLMLSTPCWGQVAISGLPSASAVNDTDIFPATQGGTTRGVSGAQIRAYALPWKDVRNYSGADLGAKIIACLADLPSGRGTCDARSFTAGSEEINATITVPSEVTLLLGQANPITATALPVFKVNDYSAIIGLPGLTIVGPGGAGALITTENAALTYNVYVSDINFVANVGGTPATPDGSIGLDMTYAHIWTVERVFVRYMDIGMQIGGTNACACYNTIIASRFHAALTAEIILDSNAVHNQFIAVIAHVGGTRGLWWKDTAGSGDWGGDNLFLGLDVEGGDNENTQWGIDIGGVQNVFMKPYIEMATVPGGAGVHFQAGAKRNILLGGQNTAGVNFSDVLAADRYTNTYCMGAAVCEFGGGSNQITIAGVPVWLGAGLESQSIAIGENSGNSNVDGGQNTSTGYYSLHANQSGDNNAAFAAYASSDATDPDATTAFGAHALQSNQGDNNTGLGAYAGQSNDANNVNTTGTNNTWVGAFSGPASTTQNNYASCLGAFCKTAVDHSVTLGTVDEITIIPPNTVAGIGTCDASKIGAMKPVTDALAPAVGATVVGGGGAKAMAWCNGANWTVMGI